MNDLKLERTQAIENNALMNGRRRRNGKKIDGTTTATTTHETDCANNDSEERKKIQNRKNSELSSIEHIDGPIICISCIHAQCTH